MSEIRPIDANALKEAIEEQHRLDKEIAPLVESISYHKLNNLIDNAPTVETTKAEHKAYNEGFKDGVNQGIKLSEKTQGEWIEKEDTPASVYYCCSNCDMEGIPITPYCPWCGAKMRKGDKK